MQMNDMVIMSVDDHIVEPPDLFKKHLPANLLAKAPRVERIGSKDFWTYDGVHLPNFALNAVVGRPKSELGFEPNNYDQIRKACWDVDARIDDMNANGIAASLNFGTFANFAGETFLVVGDRSINYTLLQAYNDWHIDDWCAAYPGRFIPLAVLPLWDVNLMVQEVRRVIGKGCRAVSFPGIPELYGLPSIHDSSWDPFWKIIDDENVQLCIHIGPGGGSEHLSKEGPIESFMTKPNLCAMSVTAEYLWSNVIRKYKNFKIVLSEGGIGWVPFILERADLVLKNHGEWTGRDVKGQLPSDLFRERFVTCFIVDRFGLATRNFIGIDTITYECDYPHADVTWPKTPECLWEDFTATGCTDEEIDKITFKNAARVFGFDPVDKAGGRDKINVGALREKAKDVDVTTIISGGTNYEHKPGEFITGAAMERMFPQLNDLVADKSKREKATA